MNKNLQNFAETSMTRMQLQLALNLTCLVILAAENLNITYVNTFSVNNKDSYFLYLSLTRKVSQGTCKKLIRLLQKIPSVKYQTVCTKKATESAGLKLCVRYYTKLNNLKCRKHEKYVNIQLTKLWKKYRFFGPMYCSSLKEHVYVVRIELLGRHFLEN